MPAAPPPRVIVVTAGSQVMLSAAGIRMRMSCVAVMTAVGASDTVIVIAAVETCPTVNVWFAAEESATVPGSTMEMILSSVAAVAPPAPATTSCKLLADEAAVKFMNLSPAIVTWSLPAKFEVTLMTAVLLPSS